MSRLREYVRDQVLEDDEVDVAENVLSFRRPLSSAGRLAKAPGATAFVLINQAAERIENIDVFAAERQVRAEHLVKQAIEQLKVAHAKVRSADQLKTECISKVQDADKLLERASCRIATIEAKLFAAEQRAKAAEIRASAAEDALGQIEEALRTRILGKIWPATLPSIAV